MVNAAPAGGLVLAGPAMRQAVAYAHATQPWCSDLDRRVAARLADRRHCRGLVAGGIGRWVSTNYAVLPAATSRLQGSLVGRPWTFAGFRAVAGSGKTGGGEHIGFEAADGDPLCACLVAYLVFAVLAVLRLAMHRVNALRS